MGHRLNIGAADYMTLRNHFFQNGMEQAAFLYADVKIRDGDALFDVRSLEIVPPAGFDHRSSFHLALSDDQLGSVIKTAWDRGCSLIEAHSHPGAVPPVQFSTSDLYGLNEVVPHVWWRLGARPYLALVVGPRSFDALVWTTSPEDPEPLEMASVAGRAARPTRLTFAWLNGVEAGGAHG